MSTATTTTKSAAGKLFLVTGLSGGREIFLGRAIDPYEPDRLTLEGKVLSMRPPGRLVVRPFPTTTRIDLRDPTLSVQHIAHPRAYEEALGVLALTATHVSRTSFPSLVRWVEVALRSGSDPLQAEAEEAPYAGDPFLGLFESFLSTSEEFRRILFGARQVDTTRELDQTTELEGDLLIEIGKVTNQVALKLNRILARERDLADYIEALAGPDLCARRGRASMGGWPYLFGRLSASRAWARRNAKAELVREINGLKKDGIFALNEILLDHGNSLDTLITETFGQYGLEAELPGEIEEEQISLRARRRASLLPQFGGTVLPAGASL